MERRAEVDSSPTDRLPKITEDTAILLYDPGDQKQAKLKTKRQVYNRGTFDTKPLDRHAFQTIQQIISLEVHTKSTGSPCWRWCWISHFDDWRYGSTRHCLRLQVFFRGGKCERASWQISMTDQRVARGHMPVSYTHLTLPTTPYV